jgi:hypothetical protein
LLLGLLDVAEISGSGVDGVILVEEVEVAHVPDGQQGNRDEYELAASEDRGSGGVGLLGEEYDKEGAGNDEWDQQNLTNKDVPPVIILVQEAVEDLNEEEYEEEEGNNTDAVNTAFDWEATTASEILGLLGLALADAAAAHFVILLL